MIGPVSAALARQFVIEHHYSRTAVSGVLRYGWYDGDVLMGVSIYDLGNHAMRQGVFGKENFSQVMHHHRLALHPDAPKFTASQFIAASHRQIVLDRPETSAVVTYADLCQGHSGTIYRATNALYTGLAAKGNLKFLTPDGELRPTQSLKGTWPERRATAAELGWSEVRCLGKPRYVYLLGSASKRRASRKALKWPVIPYCEIPDLASSLGK